MKYRIFFLFLISAIYLFCSFTINNNQAVEIIKKAFALGDQDKVNIQRITKDKNSALIISAKINDYTATLAVKENFNTWKIDEFRTDKREWFPIEGVDCKKATEIEYRVKNAWDILENVLQRRSDLIPRLVEIFKSYTSNKEKMLSQVIEELKAFQSAQTPKDKIAATKNIEISLHQLLTFAEDYPNLKANENFMRLQDELAGTENRIAIERKRYNDQVAVFRGYALSAVGSVAVKIRGIDWEKYEYFKKAELAQTAPLMPTTLIEDSLKSMQVVDLETKWVSKEYQAWPPKLVLAPAISFRVKNTSAKPLAYVNFNAIFKFKDDEENLGDNFLSGIGGTRLLPGQLSPVIHIKSNFGVEGKSLASFKNNPMWKVVVVRLFTQSGGSNPVLLGTYTCSREIDFQEPEPVSPLVPKK